MANGLTSVLLKSWAWTMLAPYISYCPENTTRLAWQNFPTLHILKAICWRASMAIDCDNICETSRESR
jgi:hypothetical protein